MKCLSRLLVSLITAAIVLPYMGGITVQAAGGIAINRRNFPDAAFRSVIASRDYDRDGNGYLSNSEIGQTLNIYCQGRNIHSLQGIQYFTALQGLWCADNAISSVDLSGNPDLRGVWCSGNNFTSLDFSGNPELVWVYCYDCNLTSLNVANNPKLAFIECNTNPLATLDVTHNPELEHLMCGSCELTSLNLTNNPKLAHLDAFRNHLTSLDVSHNPLLKRLDIWDNAGLGSINLINNPGLQYYNCANNGATSIDVTHNPQLQKLICSYNSITSLNLSNNPQLVYLDCACNQIGSLDLSNNPRLFFLQAFTNPFTTLNIGNNSRLVRTYNTGVCQSEYAVCQGHSWTLDYGEDLMYFLCFDDAVTLSTAATGAVNTADNYVSTVDALPADADCVTRGEAVQALYELAGCPAVNSSSTGYSDVQPGSAYAAAVVWARNNGICYGYPDISSDTFGAGTLVNRQDMAFMLHRFAIYRNWYSAFDYGRIDNIGDYYEIAYYAWGPVTWAMQWNIMSTRGPGLIYPHGRVSRTELNSMINNMVGMN